VRILTGNINFSERKISKEIKDEISSDERERSNLEKRSSDEMERS
jgi:hypothetical protein